MKTKICTKCKESKPLECFHKNKGRKDGVQGHCKLCVKIAKHHRIQSGYYVTYYQQNKNKIKKWTANYYQRNKKKCSKKERLRRQTDINFLLKCRLRSRISNALKGNHKSARTEILLGCSTPQFKVYIENQFKPGMAWKNYGAIWHLDHIIPCASFDMSKPEDQRKCFHHTNYQPLWATTAVARARGDMTSIGNLEKGDSMPHNILK